VLIWFGHSSYFIQIDGKRILVDPVFSGNASPLPGTVKSFKGTDAYNIADLPEINYLFISHDHYDHVDYSTLIALKNKTKKVICGLGVGSHFEHWGYTADQIIEKDWYDKKIVSTFQRDLKVMEIDSCPVPEWCGETGQMIFDRLQKFQAGDTSVARSEREYTELNKIETRASEARFFLHLLKEYDRDIRWHMLVGNDRPEVLEKMLFDENTLPGFNDSGAHLINLAFFDGNLLTLQIAQKDSLEKVAVAVRRLTKEPAEFFGMNVGTLDIGTQADITIIDPRELKDYDSVANRKMVYREVFDAEQLVNRSDNVVSNVFIAGTEVWKKNEALEPLGKTRLGRHLTFHGRPNEL